MAIQIKEPTTNSDNHIALFSLGFRPFFIVAGIFAVALIIIWIRQLSYHDAGLSYYSPVIWHGHEMLYGYAMAVIAGFLLTAVGNWTGQPVLFGWRLQLLVYLWFIARILPLIESIPGWLIAIADVALIPLLIISIAIPILKAKQWNNTVFIIILLLLGLLNLLLHLHILGEQTILPVNALRLALYLVVMLVAIMGGRVIPFFTERGLEGVKTTTWPWLEILVIPSIVLLAISDVFLNMPAVTGMLALFALILHGIRLSGWYTNKIWTEPLVWILQAGYFWLLAGFLFKSLSLFQLSEEIFSYHAFTVGGVGALTLGMMSRVSLGHTGRQMRVNAWMTLAFVMLNIAVIFRVVMPVLFKGQYMSFVTIAGWLWVLSFIIFVINYLPILVKSRVDE